jgi:hypothetical protein
MLPRQEAVEKLNATLLPLMIARRESLGVDGSGGYNYYHARLQQDRVLLDYEIALVDALRTVNLPIKQIHEVGCGWGQFVFLLAWCGYRATGFEIDQKRFASAHFFEMRLRAIEPQLMRFCSIVKARFPISERHFGHPFSLVVTTNLVSQEAIETRLVPGLLRYRFALIDVDRFCRKRGPEDRHLLIRQLEEMGFKHLGLFSDVGESGQYHLFQPVKKIRQWFFWF